MTRVVAYTLEQCWHRVPGGTARSALGTAVALRDAEGVRLVGVAAAHRHPPRPEWQPAIPVRHLRLPRNLLYEAWHRLRRPHVESATGPVDVIHATGMAVPPRTAPLVVTVHDLAFVHYPGHATRVGRRFFSRSLELTRRDADLVLCPSEATRRDCVANGFAPDRLQVVPWGIDLPVPGSADPDRDEARLGPLGLRPQGYVLWVGTVEPRKNLAGLVEAFARLGRPDLNLALVGPAGWNEDLRTRVAGIASQVRVLGFVSRADLAILYRCALAFCYPSLLEGFGMPVLEAMAEGAAVVTSQGTATAEVAGDAGVLVDPHDPAAIAAGLASVVDDPARRAALAARGRERAATFTWARTATATEAAYAKVAP